MKTLEWGEVAIQAWTLQTESLAQTRNPEVSMMGKMQNYIKDGRGRGEGNKF